MTTYKSKVSEDTETGEYIIDLPVELTEQLGWEVGDTLNWEINDSNEIILKKVKKMKTFAVETIATFRHVYFIECESEEHAMDTVTMQEAENSFQQYIGEQIVSAREVTKKEIIRLINETEQPNLTEEEFDSKPWLRNSVHVVDYTK